MIESLIELIAVIIYFIIAYKCVKIFFNWYNKRSAGKNLYSENQSSSTELDPSYIEGVLDENDSPDEILGIRTEDLSYTTKIGLVGLKANIDALKKRIGKSEVKQEKLLNLLCDNNFISYYRNNNQDHLHNNPFIENFLAASREIKDDKSLLLSTGIEIIAPILSFENESNEYFVYIRDELMRE